MKKHTILSNFNIVNVAGDGDAEEENSEALSMVEKAITDNPENTYTITISCGRLTTGVSIPAWSAVLMLSGTYSTSASSYLQTIFRVQTPANMGGKIKEKCFVFDFSPDRTLKMVAEAVSLNTRVGVTDPTGKKQMSDFLNFCPVIAIAESQMQEYDVGGMLQQLKRAYAERVVRNGFDDTKIYNDSLLKLDGLELEKFEKLKEIIGASKQTKKTNDIDINTQGFNEEEYEQIQAIEKKPVNQRTPEELALLEKKKEKKKNQDTAISILRGISIRIPLMIYGADIDIEEDITPDNFTDIIDDKSWEEFMPKGITKGLYKEFAKYYDNDIFVSAGRNIRVRTLGSDNLPVTERIKRIADIFSMFKNPDKETVLTPWRVVNMHLGDTIGGYNYFEEWDNTISIEKPRYVEDTIPELFKSDKKILEINSKTGLYPLYVAYSYYREMIKAKEQNKNSEHIDYWGEVLQNNVYVVCKTKMAKSITKRTLAGYKDYKLNIIDFENIVEVMANEPIKFNEKILSTKTWGRSGNEMKFDCIVGNPPYQENISNSQENSSLGKQLFPMFIINCINLNTKYISLITPSRWFAGDAQDKSFVKLREFIKENNHISKIFNYNDASEVFDNVQIKGGISYSLYNREYCGKSEFSIINKNIKSTSIRELFEEGMDIILSDENDIGVIEKLKKNKFESLINITKGRNAFGIVGKEDVVNKISSSNKYQNAIRLQCKKQEIRWTDEDKITKNIDIYNSYKVFISKSAGDPAKDKKVIGKPFVAEPKSACTDSLIPIGKFDTFEEAYALQKYLKTKFLRYLVSILKVSQNVSQNVYQFVPMQDFKPDSDIKWNEQLTYIDNQLYKKYGLNENEIKNIESKIEEVI